MMLGSVLGSPGAALGSLVLGSAPAGTIAPPPPPAVVHVLGGGQYRRRPSRPRPQQGGSLIIVTAYGDGSIIDNGRALVTVRCGGYDIAAEEELIIFGLVN